MLDSLNGILPHQIRRIINRLPDEVRDGLEEIRIRKYRPLEIIYNHRSAFVGFDSQLVPHSSLAYRPTEEDCQCFLELTTQHSLYSFEEELKQGYITVAGGHRIGLAGRTIVTSGQVKMIRDVGSFNIRVARQKEGTCQNLLPYLIDRQQRKWRMFHTLVLSLPGQGKTTLLRDIARSISQDESHTVPYKQQKISCKVAIIDERSELAACVQGRPSFDLGPRVDVMDACPKAQGMMMMIRSMSPDVLIVDEIGNRADVQAIQEARYAGIRVIASAHAADFAEACRSPILKEVIASGVFERYVFLHRSLNSSMRYQVLDGAGREWATVESYSRKG